MLSLVRCLQGLSNVEIYSKLSKYSNSPPITVGNEAESPLHSTDFKVMTRAYPFSNARDTTGHVGEGRTSKRKIVRSQCTPSYLPKEERNWEKVTREEECSHIRFTDKGR